MPAAVGINGQRHYDCPVKAAAESLPLPISCIKYGMQYAGDDHVFLDTINGDRVYGLYSTAKLNDDMQEKIGITDAFENKYFRRPDEKKHVDN